MASDMTLHTVGTCEDAFGDEIEVSVITGGDDGFGDDGETAAVHIDGPASFTLDKAGREEFQRLFMEAERLVEANPESSGMTVPRAANCPECGHPDGAVATRRSSRCQHIWHRYRQPGASGD